MALVLSVVALILGPLVYALGQRQPNARQILDGFIFITIAGIVCVYIIPDAIGSGGWYAIGFLLAGLAFPVVFERIFERSLHRAHVFILVLAAIGLVIHATIDGIALLPLNEPKTGHAGWLGPLEDQHLAIGVILHRLPVGMAIWWSIRPSLGTPVAVATFALIIVATTVAYLFGAPVIAWSETQGLAWFQAFVAGSLVHVVAFGVSHGHAAHIEPASGAGSWAYRVGILLGLFLVFTLPHTDIG